MAAKNIDGSKLKEAIAKFGSLQKAIENQESLILTEKKERDTLKKEIGQLQANKKSLQEDIAGLQAQFNEKKTKLEELGAQLGSWERQYRLFEGFLSMVLSSPSVSSSVKNLADLFENLDKTGWTVAKTSEDLRGHFVRTVIGDYLKCFRCKSCGARFITNAEPHRSLTANYYVCPCCHNGLGVEPDDTFLKALVPDAQFNDILTMRDIKKENDTLKPLKPFLNIACEICGKPITEWDAENVKIAVEKFCWGHTKCWRSDIGELILRLKSGRDMQGKGTK